MAAWGVWRRRVVVAALFVLVALPALPTFVEAQQGWLGDRRRLEGPGFRVGRLEIHPGIASELGYDSNVFLESQDPDGSLMLRLSGHVDVATLGQQRSAEGETEAARGTTRRRVAFRGGVGGAYYDYLTADAKDNVEVAADATVTVNPDGRFRLRFGDTFLRSIRPFVDSTPEGARLPTYVLNRNVASAALFIDSKGRQVTAMLGYDLALELFRDSSYTYLDNLDHRLESRVTWRFLPNTALVQKTTLALQRYLRPDERPLSQVVDGERLETSLGLNGQLTPKLALTVMGGYALGFYQGGEAEEYESWSAQVEGRYRVREELTAALGYFRRFFPAYIGNFVKSDRVYGTLTYLGAGRLLLRGEASVSFDETGLALLPDGDDLGSTSHRNDIRLLLAASGEYRFKSWFALMASVRYRSALTDFVYSSDIPSGAPLIDPKAGFQAVEAWLGLRVFY